MMRVTGWMVVIAASATMAVCWGQAPTGAPAPACNADLLPILQNLWSEVRHLRAELLEDRRAVQQAKLHDLEKQMGSLQEQQRELDQEQSSRTSQLAEIETQLREPNLENNARQELESQKAQLLSLPPGPSPTIQNALFQREATMRGLLAEQEQRVNALDQLAQQLAAGAQ